MVELKEKCKNEFEKHVAGLCKSLYDPRKISSLDSATLTAFKEKAVVVLPCGGESKRMAALAQDKHKTALYLPGDETFVTRMIKFYASQGAKKFVLLVGVNAESVIETTQKKCQNLGVKIEISPDPGKPVGRGGAILNALEKGFIPTGSPMIVHNADDQIFGYQGNFLDDIVSAYLAFEKQGACAMAVVALTTPFAYTAMEIASGQVKRMASKPQIPIPAHIGLSVIGAEVQKRFSTLFDYSGKKDFEEHLFPLLIEEGKLYGFGIPGEVWYAVNTPKEYENFVKKLSETVKA